METLHALENALPSRAPTMSAPYLQTGYANPDPGYRNGEIVGRSVPDDKKLEEYRAWGVRHVWLVDPQGRRLCECNAGLHEVSALQLPDLGIEVTPADVFD